jgi:predicted ester cyclase
VGAGDFDIQEFIKSTFTRIWNDKLVGTVYERYMHNAAVYGALGRMEYGRDRLVEKIIFFLAEFPDTEITVEDCITSGERGAAGKVFCRWTLRAHHTGEGIYGSPAGNPVEFTGITCCTVKDRRITEQWDEWDRRSLLRQLRIDEKEFIYSRLEQGRGNIDPPGAPSPGPAELCFPAPPDPVSRVWGEVARLSGQDAPDVPSVGTSEGGASPAEPPPPPSSAAEADTFIRALYQHIWNLRNIGMVDQYYSGDVTVHGPSGRIVDGRDELKTYILSMLAPFPDAALFLDDLFLSSGTAGGPIQAAVRWSIAGTHRRHGRYGPPTGISLRITGLSMLKIKNGTVTEELTEFGEFELVRRLEQKRLIDAQQAGAEHADYAGLEEKKNENRTEKKNE